MPEYMTLLGAEDVRQAASIIRNAAETMRQAASHIESVFAQQRLFIDDRFMQLEALVKQITERR